MGIFDWHNIEERKLSPLESVLQLSRLVLEE
jgi:hypothetical protein